MALEAQNNPFTSVLLVEAADPEALPDSDPSAGQQRLALGTDHLLYLVNSSGTKTAVGGAGSGAGYEYNYTAKTSSTSVTGTTEAGAQTIVTSGAVTYDGSSVVLIEFYTPAMFTSSTAQSYILVLLYEDTTLLGQIGIIRNIGGGVAMFGPLFAGVRRTPSNASHTYTVKAYVNTGTGSIEGGTGGTGNYVAAYIRITKV